MRIFKVFTCLLFCCILLSAEPHHYVAIAPFVGKGVTSEQLSNLTDLFRKRYNEVAKYKAMAQDQMDKNLVKGFERLDIVSEMSYAMAMGRLLSVQCVILGTINKSDKTSKCILKIFNLNSQKRIKDFTISFKGSPRKFLTAIIPKIVKVIDPVIVEKKVTPIPVVTKSKVKPAEKVKPERKKETEPDKEKEEVSTAEKTEKKQVVSSKAVKKEERSRRKKKLKKKKIVAAPKAPVVAVTPTPKPEKETKEVKEEAPEKKVVKEEEAKKEELAEAEPEKKKQKTRKKQKLEKEKVVKKEKTEEKKVALKKGTSEKEKKQEKRKGGIITAVTTGVSAAIAIPVVIILKSKDDGEEPVQDSFFLTVEW